jgi:hypothetical protein
MSRMKENKIRERRIEMEVVVDAYTAEERAMGWYYYLEERLKVPFNARCKSKRELSSSLAGEIFLDVQQWPRKKSAGYVVRVAC